MAHKSNNKSRIQNGSNRRWFEVLRFGIVGLLATIGCAAMVAYTASHWVERQVLTTDNWVAMVGPLPQAPVVTSALSGFITTHIFANVPIEQEIQNVLPPKAAFLANPLTSQLKSLTAKITGGVIKSDNFETIWTAANRKAMDRLTMNARGQTKPPSAKLEQKFSLNINDVKSKISDKLGNTSTALPTLNVNSGKVLAITTDLKAKRERVWSYVRSVDYLSAVLPFVMLVSFFGALAFAQRRRRATLIIAASSIVLLLLELIALKQTKQSVLSQVRVPGNEPAISYIFDTLTHSLKNIINTWLVGWLVILVICILSGPYDWAVSLRKLVRLDKAKDSSFFAGWYAVRGWTNRNMYYVWIAIGGITLFWLAFAANVNNRVLSNSVLTALALIAIIYIIAHPRQKLIASGK